MVGYRNPNWRWLPELANPVMLSVAITIFIRRSVTAPSLVRTTMRRAAPALVLVVLAVLSVRWSINRTTTILSLEWLLIVTLLGLALASVRPVSVVIDGFALFGVCAVATGCWLSYRAPSYRYFGDWMGLFGNKNGFGALIAFVVPFILVAGHGSRWRIAVAVGSTVGMLAALTRIGSRTSTVAVALELVVLTVVWVVSHLRRRRRTIPRVSRRARGPVVFAGIAALLAPGIGLLRGRRLDFDATFSNRTLIWPELWRVFRSHWFHGFGAGGFWSGSKGYLVRSQTLSGNASGMVTAHNGYLQEALSFGILGLAATIFLSLVLLGRGLNVAGKGRHGEGLLILLAAVAIIVQNSMEAMFTNPQGIHWLVIVLISGLAPSMRRGRWAHDTARSDSAATPLIMDPSMTRMETAT